MCDYKIAHKKFVNKVWDMSPTIGLPLTLPTNIVGDVNGFLRNMKNNKIN